MIEFKSLKEIALANVSDPDTEYFYRYVCRWYSKTFSTPLHEVSNLPIYNVMLAYFEEGYESLEEEDRFFEIMRLIDPDYDDKEEKSVQDFIRMIEEEEENKRLAKAEKSQQAPDPITQAPSTTPVVRTFNDDTPDDEIGDL